MKVLIAILLLIAIASATLANVMVSGPAGLTGRVLVNLNGVYVPPPVANFTFDTNAGVNPLSVALTDSTSNTPTSWDWNFGDGSLHSASQNPSHTYTAGGRYTVTLLTSNAGGSSTTNKAVTVYFPVNLYVDAETGSSGDFITPTVMTNASHGSLGAWTVSGSASNHFQITTSFEQQLFTPVVQGGTTYSDSSSTRGFAVDIHELTNYAAITFTSQPTNISVGCWIKPASIGGTFTVIDYMQMNDSLGRFAAVQSGSTFGLHAHGNTNGVTTVGVDIAWSAGTTYWLTFKFAAGSPGAVTVKLFDTAANLIGTSSCPSDASAMIFFNFGRTDNHNGGTQPPSASIFYDDLVIDTSTAAFPLGP